MKLHALKPVAIRAFDLLNRVAVRVQPMRNRAGLNDTELAVDGCSPYAAFAQSRIGGNAT